MIRRTLAALILALVAASGAAALTPGTEIIVPAAGRGEPWSTDLYIMNPGGVTASVTVEWLVRDQANPNPVSVGFVVAPGETLVLTDVIFEDFGVDEGYGAFRVVADQPVLTNSRIFSFADGETFGQGFEGVPVGLSTAAGETTDIVGLSQNSQFRTNVYGCAGAEGAKLEFSLIAPDGTLLATGSRTLGAWAPFLRRTDQLLGSGPFDEGTLRVTVTEGSAVVGASKVDRLSTDPTTLESAVRAGAADVDGTYHLAVTDSLTYETGGSLVIADGQVDRLRATYTNWDKLEGGESVCRYIFQFGRRMSTPVSLDDLSDGVTFTEDYTVDGLGMITYTVSIDVVDNVFLEGFVDAEGSGFPTDLDGCNGTFPTLALSGGKEPTAAR
jgi:hypothetical protein